MKGSMRAKQRGAALMELAIVLPAMILISTVLIELGGWIRQHLALTEIAYEGARYAAEKPGLTNDDGLVLDRIEILLNRSSIDSLLLQAIVRRVPGPPDEVEIQLRSSFESFSPIGQFLGPVTTTVRSPYLMTS